MKKKTNNKVDLYREAVCFAAIVLIAAFSLVFPVLA